jgi:hypothetical protein
MQHDMKFQWALASVCLLLRERIAENLRAVFKRILPTCDYCPHHNIVAAN